MSKNKKGNTPLPTSQDNTTSSETKTISHSKKNKKKYAVIISSCILVALITISSILFSHFISIANHMFIKTQDSVIAIENKIKTFDNVRKAYNYFDRKESSFYSQMIVKYLYTTAITIDNIDDITNYIEDTDTYFIKDDTLVYKSTDSPEFTLTSSEISTLKAIGYIYSGDNLYSIAEFNKNRNEYIINRWAPLIYPSFLSEKNIVSSGESDVMIVRKDTSTIVDSSVESFIGLTYNENSLNNINLNGLNTNISVYAPENAPAVLCMSIDTDNEYKTIGFIYVSNFLRTLFYESIIQIFMFLCVVILACVYTFHLYNENHIEANEANLISKKIKHIHGKFYIDTSIQSHITALYVVGIIIFLIGSFYVQLLLNYSTFSKEGSNNLTQMSLSLSDNAAYQESIREYYEASYIECAKIIAKYITQTQEHEYTVSDDYTVKSPLTAQEAESLRNILDIKKIEVIDVFGRIVASSNNSMGYFLDTENSTSDLECSLVNKGSEEDKVIHPADNPDTILVVVKRQEMTGVIRLTIDTSSFNDLTNCLNEDDAILAANFGIADKYYIKSSQSDTLFYINAGGREIKKLANTISSDLYINHYEGTSKINGINYYINAEDINGTTFLSAIVLSDIYEMSFVGVIVGILGLFATYLIMMSISSLLIIEPSNEMHVVTEEEEFKTEIADDNVKKLMDTSFIRYINILIMVTIIVLYLLLLLDYKMSDESLLHFLLGNDWQKGFSIFSFTLCITSIVIGKVISLAQKRIILLIGNNVGSKGLTISRMLSGLIDVAIFFAVFVLSAIEFGLDPTKLFASLGVTGVVFGLGAQNTVNDLLSGLFIIFEGNFKVGDWVDINGWRGQVKEIGVRTTKIGYGGDIKIFKNSSLDGVIALSYTMSGVLATVDIAYESDVEQVIKLIESNTELYTREYKTIVDGPKVHGVTKLGDSGITIRIWAIVESEESVARVHRGILRITKRLFDDNGIEIPFNQMVIHESKS